MKEPYVFNISKDAIVTDVSNAIPTWCNYTLYFAEQRNLISVSNCEILTQHLNHSRFYIELTQVKNSTKLKIPFSVDERHLILYFSLKGSHKFLTHDNNLITTVTENTFLMSYYDKGEYYLEILKGDHLALIVSISPEWLDEISSPYPKIRNVLSKFRTESDQYLTMYHSNITNQIKGYLEKIYRHSQKHPGPLEGALTLYISNLLEYYDNSLANNRQKSADKIKKYIEENFAHEELSVETIASYFSLTTRTLLNQFKSHHVYSVKDYITELRMTEADRLSLEEYLTPKDIFYRVGYTDLGTFRSAALRYKRKKK